MATYRSSYLKKEADKLVYCLIALADRLVYCLTALADKLVYYLTTLQELVDQVVYRRLDRH